MIRRITKLLFVLLVASITAYLVVKNSSPLTVHLAPGSSITGYSGVILIGSFFVGVFLSSIVGMYFAFQAYLREKKLHNRESIRAQVMESLLEAKLYVSSDELGRAVDRWQTIIRKASDPVMKLIGYIELSCVLERSGEPIEALRTLDLAKAIKPDCIEVLFRSVELNLLLKNKTAALDNLALINYHHPNRKAALIARELSKELGRFEDAMEYQNQLEKLGADIEILEKGASEIAFEILKRDIKEKLYDPTKSLEEFVKNHPSNAEALEMLAKVEENNNRFPEAASLLIKAAKIRQTPASWHSVSRVWLKAREPERAISSIKTAKTFLEGKSKYEISLDLVRLYASLGMYEEARTELSAIQTDSLYMFPDLVPTFMLLNALIRGKLGEQGTVSALFNLLDDYNSSISAFELPGVSRDTRLLEPPKTLSIP